MRIPILSRLRLSLIAATLFVLGLSLFATSLDQSTAWAVPVPDVGTTEGEEWIPEGGTGDTNPVRLPATAPHREGMLGAPARAVTDAHRSPSEESVLDALTGTMDLGSKPLVFDPTPDDATSGDEVLIGTIEYEQGTGPEFNLIQVTYLIDSGKRATYDLQSVRTTINESVVDSGLTDLPGLDEYTYVHVLTLPVPLPDGITELSIKACATIRKHDVESVSAGLPSVGTVRVDTNGNIAGVASYFDTIITPGWIAKSTDIDNDTVTFDADPGWATGEAVRVLQGYTDAPTNTGLVSPPTTTDTTTSATYYVRNLGTDLNGDFVYSFHTSYNNALADTGKQDITAELPTTGEIIVAGEKDALAFLGQTPINESLVPASTKTTLTTTTGPLVTATDITNDTVDLASAVTWVNGDRVQVSGASGGGLNANTTYYVRVVDSDTVSFHTSWAGAQNNTSRVNITVAIATTRTVDPVDPDDETVTFADDPVWATGTGVRVNTTGGGLSAGTTYYVRSLGGGVYSFFDTAANATNTDADGNPLNGRRDLTAPITASVFANLTTLSFENAHRWATGTVVRINATGGGLSVNTNYFVRVTDGDTISLHTTLANAQGNTSPIVFTAPIVALLTPMFDGWCVDNDRYIYGNEYIANIYSSYDLGSFSDTGDDPKDQHLTEGGISPINTSMVPASTNTTTDQVTFTTNHGWATQQAVQVTATDDGLSSGTTYYVRVINANTVSFHPTAAASNNAGPVPASTSFANVGLVPSATNITAGIETVDFAVAHGWTTGDVVRVTATGGGLTAGANNYARVIDTDTISFYDTAANAIAGGLTGLRNLTANITATVYKVDLTSTDDTVIFVSGHGFATGDIVTPAATGGGLTGGTAYYLYNVDGDTFSFHTASPTADNKVNLTASITTSINERVDLTAAISATTIVFRAQSIDFAVDTQWPNGSPVRVSVGDGGLVAGTTYYARAQSMIGGAADTNSISLYDTRGHAVAGGTTGLITFTDPIETITFTTGPTVTATDTTNETVDLSASVSWLDGDPVQVSVTGGGLTAGVTYYVRMIDSDTISFFTSAANAQGFDNVGRVGLSGALALTTTVNPVDPTDTTQTVFYVPENLVEYPENLDVMNWVLNQNYQAQLADGQTPTVTTYVDTAQVPASTIHDNVGYVPTSTDTVNETVTFGSDPAWTTATMVRLDADGGGLSAANNYYVRNLTGGVYSFYNSAANATVGGTTGRSNLTAAITADVFTPSLASTEDTVTFDSGHGFVTGSVVNVTADGGGLDASTTYYLYNVSGDTFSFHTAAATAANKVNLTAAVEPRAVYLPTDNTVTVPVYGWTTGLRVRVSVDGGGLTAGTDYYIRALSTTTIAFYATAADASNNVNRIDLTGTIDIEALVRPYYTEGDVQRAVWELIENTPGDPGNWSPLRVAEILVAADGAVGIGEMSVDFVPDCGGTVAIILMPFQVEQPSNQQLTIAQITVAEIPNYCAEGYSCQEITLDLGSISGTKFEDMDGDGVRDEGELGLAGWLIFVDYDGDDVFSYSDANDSGTFDEGDTASEPFDVTDDSGAYAIGGILWGEWQVIEVAQDDWVPTVPDDGVYTIPVTPSDFAFAAKDFGNFQLFDICGVKVWDVDRDGAAGTISDFGDMRLEGVRMYWDVDGNGEWSDGEMYALTAVDGTWCLNDLGPVEGGFYDIQEDMSTAIQASDEWQSSGAPAPIPAVSGTSVGNADFYNYKFPPGEYRTYSQGGWASTGAPGQYLVANFANAFPGGLTVPMIGGCGEIELDSAAEVQSFLRASKKSPFTDSDGCPSRYTPTNLDTQFVALSLSVGFDAYDENFGTGSPNLGDLTLCNLTDQYAVANGLTVSEYLAQVAFHLDGSSNYSLGLSSGDLIQLLNNTTLGFDNGVVTPWAEVHLC